MTIQHILLECRQFNQERSKHDIPNSLFKFLNNNVPINSLNINNILNSIKDTNLYKTIKLKKAKMYILFFF